MPSTAAKLGTGALVALVLAYALLVARQILLGVVVSAVLVLTAWLLVEGRESDVIRSLRTPKWVAAFAVAALVIVYSVVLARRLLFGVLFAAFVLLLAVAQSYLADRGHPASMGRTRTLAITGAAVVVLVYALLVARQLLLGLVAVLLLYLTAWLTSPGGPVVGRRTKK